MRARSAVLEAWQQRLVSALHMVVEFERSVFDDTHEVVY